MDKIKFTNGIIEKLSFDYYNLTLFNKNNTVYQSTIDRFYAAELIDKYDNKKIKLI